MAFPSWVYTSDTNHMSKRKTQNPDVWKWKIRFQKDKAALDWCSDMSNLRKMTIAVCHKQNEMEKGVLIIILFVSSCFGKNFSWIHQHDIHVHEMCLTFTEGFFSSTKWFEAVIAICFYKGKIKTLFTILTRN